MSDDLYMNGVGIKQRTRDLTDKLWVAVLPAIFGTTTMICGPALAWLAFIYNPRTDRVADWEWLVAAAIAAASVVVGFIASHPWHVARLELNAHTAAMEAETAKRGNGWAQS